MNQPIGPARFFGQFGIASTQLLSGPILFPNGLSGTVTLTGSVDASHNQVTVFVQAAPAGTASFFPVAAVTINPLQVVATTTFVANILPFSIVVFGISVAGQNYIGDVWGALTR